MSCVADEKPSSTAANAIMVRCPPAGSIRAMPAIAAIMDPCASSIHPRRRPNLDVRRGMGNVSTSGAQTNLKE